MLPRRVIFATNVSKTSGAGHFKRLVEISRALPPSIEKRFFGSVEISWLREISEKAFLMANPCAEYGANDLLILDSYDEAFCRQAGSLFLNSTIIQIADRYTPLLPHSFFIFMDLPFPYFDSLIEPRVIAHGIKYLPTRRLSKPSMQFLDHAKRVLITTGGLVNENIFSLLIAELAKKKYRDVRFEFIGRCQLLPKNTHNFHFHSLGSGFDSVATVCDTAISAAGTTLWDLLANQKIVGLAAIVENQRANFDYVIENRQAISIFSTDNLELNVEALQALFFDKSVRKSILKEVSGKYDFEGSARVCNLILDTLGRIRSIESPETRLNN